MEKKIPYWPQMQSVLNFSIEKNGLLYKFKPTFTDAPDTSSTCSYHLKRGTGPVQW